MPCERWVRAERLRHIPFAPFTGRRWRQPDEGQPHPTHSHKKTGHSARFCMSTMPYPAQLARAAARRRSLTGW
ncbi:hypothetical protein B5K11_02465 [Rhizobium leguminosarum bv. trifolii]|nr:hypothetical protein B5K11_02465 [Rhizobium leguminosarum bv. trifolii]